ncbi:MAG: hypothetical protein KA715_13750 [Xanthomonadaceae bacterium]|nr:hypothetical protein [Xanthomonadaceae bacterium]
MILIILKLIFFTSLIAGTDLPSYPRGIYEGTRKLCSSLLGKTTLATLQEDIKNIEISSFARSVVLSGQDTVFGLKDGTLESIFHSPETFNPKIFKSTKITTWQLSLIPIEKIRRFAFDQQFYFSNPDPIDWKSIEMVLSKKTKFTTLPAKKTELYEYFLAFLKK